MSIAFKALACSHSAGSLQLAAAGGWLAGRLAAAASPMTLIRLIRSLPEPAVTCILLVLGVDDFALRRAPCAGTVARGLPGRNQGTHLFQVALDLGDQGQEPGLRVRLLLARCRIPVRNHLADLLAPEGAQPVRRELDAEAPVKQALVEPISRRCVPAWTTSAEISGRPCSCSKTLTLPRTSPRPRNRGHGTRASSRKSSSDAGGAAGRPW